MSRQRALDFDPAPAGPPAPEPPRSFHVHGSYETAQEAQLQAERNASQEARVLAFLQEHPGQRFTPPEIARAVGIARENSVARSLSNLLYSAPRVFREPPLVVKHCAVRRPGSWGTDVCTWSAA